MAGSWTKKPRFINTYCEAGASMFSYVCEFIADAATAEAARQKEKEQEDGK